MSRQRKVCDFSAREIDGDAAAGKHALSSMFSRFETWVMWAGGGIAGRKRRDRCIMLSIDSFGVVFPRIWNVIADIFNELVYLVVSDSAMH